MNKASNRSNRPMTLAGAPSAGDGDATSMQQQQLTAAQQKKKFEKFGYSQNEVWNWLYTEDEDEEGGDEESTTDGAEAVTVMPDRLRDLYSCLLYTSDAADE